MSDKKDERNNSSSSLSKNQQDIKKAGILRKLKTMKKKYFVLRSESDSGPARLEYYDNEKKLRAGGVPKRSIPIKTCFNINRKVDAKQKYAIALYTKDDCFSVVAESEASLEEWLDAMLELQLDGSCLTGGAKLKPKFEHVWQVTVGDKSLATSRNMKGLYRLCLTSSSLTLVKVDQADPPETLEFSLMSIRRCGHTNNYFVIELGRSSITGAGELWLETEDVVIAQNMHEVTLNAMKSCREHEDFGSFSRPRSASNSENSRPTIRPRPIAVVSPQAYSGIRDRCDSLPSRPRTISEGQEINTRNIYAHQTYVESLRPYNVFPRTLSYSPPSIPNPLSPVSATCSTDSAGSSLSIEDFENCQQTDFALGRYVHNLPTDGALHTEPPIKEEEYIPMLIGSRVEGYMTMGPVSPSCPSAPSSYDYMEMRSPNVEGYIPMSPLGAQSSEQKDGYISMAPIHNPHSEGYLDMAPLSSSLPGSKAMCRKDSFAKNSDTVASSPSTADFPLDKVKSLLADTDDCSFESYIRPVRAYSMGSRPQPKKPHVSLQVDGSRIRAYSVGSQNQRKPLGNLIKTDARVNAKSSSAPLLNNRNRSATSRGDLMEIDYDNKSSVDYNAFTIEPVGRSRSGSYSSSGGSLVKRMQESKTSCDYLSMSPVLNRAKDSLYSKKIGPVHHPPGDYVSLDPSCTYDASAKEKSQPSFNPTLSRINSCTEDSSGTDKETSGSEQAKSDYTCMNFERKPSLVEIANECEEKDSSSSSGSSSTSPSLPASMDNYLSQGKGIRLNYASLDLPPPSEEDGKLKKIPSEEEAPLAYAQIDFSQKAGHL